MKKNNQRQGLITAGIVIVLLAVLVLLDNAAWVPPMLLTVLRKGVIYALVAVSMNLLNGFTGLFSLGQAGFMLLGAYSYAVLTIPVENQTAIYQQFKNGGLHFSITESLTNVMGEFGTLIGVIICLIIAGAVAALFAYLIGLPVLRLKSDYLAIATLGFAEILRALVQFEKLGPVTNGSNLLYGFTSFSNFQIGTLHLGTVMPFLFSGACIWIVVLLINSTYGRAFKAIRDDEVAAEAMGINLAKHKRMSFVISSFFAGISGGLLAMYQASVQAVTFKSAMTYEILLIVVIGGIGSITGSILASFLFVGCSEWWLRFLDNTTVVSLNGKIASVIVICVAIVGVVALIFWRNRKKAFADKRNTIFLTLIVGAVLLAGQIKFAISSSLQLPLLRSGFRMVIFSIVIMIMVLFFSKGIMGDRELPDLLQKRRNAKAAKASKGGDAQ
ncbi:MAG: branched-chain amino acid ABC transporter permease [Oscillibacter sp.]|jgi:branched-chain amino acid transport system permease protein|nr:branched-chain amino acid ABC transporter permease [Oscillibacter sp.]